MNIRTDLSPKQARFAVAYAQHHNASLAAKEADYSAGCASVTGARLLANAKVLRHIQALEAEAAVTLGVSRQRMLDELQEAAVLAKAKGDPMAVIAAWREIGKVCGFYQTKRVKVEVDVHLAGRTSIQRMEHLTDAELLELINKNSVGPHPVL